MFPCSDGVAGLAAVAQYAPNAWGLYDMTGNVWEWAWDWYGAYGSGSATDPTGPSNSAYRVRRGGGWYSFPRLGRLSFRSRSAPGSRYRGLGLRLARREAAPSSP